MRKIEDISVNEIHEAFRICNSNVEVMTFFGYGKNGSGQRFVEKLRKKANIDYHDYFNKTDKEHYESNPKRCIACDRVLPYEKRYNKFCSSTCAATYNNVKRGKRSIETRVKISESLKGNKHLTEDEIAILSRVAELREETFKKEEGQEHRCLNCDKIIKSHKFCSTKCRLEYDENKKINRWLSGENFNCSAGQTPSFIKKYLMKIHDNKCEKCGWGEINETTGKIPLEVHHIDGDCTNNRIENLQLLCPNCHSLTPNFGSLNKNSRRFHRKKKTLKDKDE